VNPNPRPFAEPMLIALLALLLAMLVLAGMVFWRLAEPGQKDVAEFGLYGTLFGTFTTGIGALIQALSRDPATARLNAQAAVTNAATLATATPQAPAPTQPVQVVQPADDPIPVTTEPAT
jgi:hypothetical protein